MLCTFCQLLKLRILTLYQSAFRLLFGYLQAFLASFASNAGIPLRNPTIQLVDRLERERRQLPLSLFGRLSLPHRLFLSDEVCSCHHVIEGLDTSSPTLRSSL